jgi:hypothetical protein
MEERPDVLVLQEITRSSAAEWKRLLSDGSHHLEHQAETAPSLCGRSVSTRS